MAEEGGHLSVFAGRWSGLLQLPPREESGVGRCSVRCLQTLSFFLRKLLPSEQVSICLQILFVCASLYLNSLPEHH